MDADDPEARHPDTVPTGFPSLDRMLGGGFRRQDLVILTGDVGSGKSSLALGIAIRSTLSGTPTMLLSGEMSEERLMERALAIEGRASIDELRSGEMSDATRAAVGASAVRLRGLPLMMRQLGGSSFEEISSALDAVPRPALLIVDALQLVAPPRPAAGSQEELALTARALKALAQERDLVVLALAHLPRHHAQRRDARPRLDDLGGMGVVKQVADQVLAIYREEMYQPGQGMEGATELIIAKNRNGPTGFVDLFFYRAWLRFEDMLDPER
jgi:replicative DNA helicase